jgi:hypothetical protein
VTNDFPTFPITIRHCQRRQLASPSWWRIQALMHHHQHASCFCSPPCAITLQHAASSLQPRPNPKPRIVPPGPSVLLRRRGATLQRAGTLQKAHRSGNRTTEKGPGRDYKRCTTSSAAVVCELELCNAILPPQRPAVRPKISRSAGDSVVIMVTWPCKPPLCELANHLRCRTPSDIPRPDWIAHPRHPIVPGTL